MQRKPRRIPSGRLSRLKPVELDPLAEYGLPSKGEKRCVAAMPRDAMRCEAMPSITSHCQSLPLRAKVHANPPPP